MPTGRGFIVRIEGGEKALAALHDRRAAVVQALYDALLEGVLRIRATIVGSFNKPGFPRRQTGRLSRAVRALAQRTETGARGIVGVDAVVPYGRILELGGMQPARVIRPKRKKALRWTTGVTRLGSVAALGFGVTRNQAFSAPRSKKGRAMERPDTHFAKEVYQPPRYQRAMPYIRPAIEAERGEIERALRTRLARALEGA